MQIPDLAKFEDLLMEFKEDKQFGAVMIEDMQKTRGEHWMQI